ncbi:dihydrodipicolinate synthase family protein [Tateyamaria pelophila]|uniref:dihydrodipicolinate synthase family protein n=1 Tax=Tateyamaria pelophila TaxID=328415 RepID=UPI001CC0E080|nr:dihydrodipicolinate synthase family protein [Tateyamaria pelophila]
MNRNSVNWSGPMPATTTPFTSDLQIDEESFLANLSRLFDSGATGMVVAGCTGEFWALTLDERARLAKLAVDASKGRGTTIVGTGSIREEEIIDQIFAAKEAGADGVLVMPPYFARVTDAEIIAHFEAIADRSVLPVVLYNIPGNAGNAITPAIADRLADLDKVVAIKESSGDWNNFQATLNRVKDRIRVFCGPSSIFGVPATLAGADGLIDCFPNVWAPGCLDLWHKTKAGDMEAAWALQETGIALTELFTTGGRTLYPATKAVMNHQGNPGGGHMRPPYRDLDGAPLETLIAGLEKLMPIPAHA